MHYVWNLHIKFHQNWSVLGRVITISVKSRWRPPSSWFLNLYFRFWIRSTLHDWKYLFLKFHLNRSIFGRVITISVKSRWRPPLSWFLVFTSGIELGDVTLGGEHFLKISWRLVNPQWSYDRFCFQWVFGLRNPNKLCFGGPICPQNEFLTPNKYYHCNTYVNTCRLT